MKLKELKAIAKELEEIVTPVDEDDNPIPLVKGKAKQIEKNIKEAAALLEDFDEDERDECSDDLLDGLKELGVAPSWCTEEAPEKPTWEEVKEMDEDDLEDTIDKFELDLDIDDYDDEDELREAVCDVLEIEEPEGSDDDNKPDFASMKKKELLAFAKENDIKVTAKEKKMKIGDLRDWVSSEWVTSDSDGDDELTWKDISEMDYDDLSDLCEAKKLITDPDDFDEDEDEEVDEFRKEVAEELDIDIVEDSGKEEAVDLDEMDAEELLEFAEENDIKLSKKQKKLKAKGLRKAIQKKLEKMSKEETSYDSVEDQLNDTTKLADLREMVEEHDEFKKLRKRAEKLTGLEGTRKLKKLMYKALGIESEKTDTKKEKSKKKEAPKCTRGGAVIKTIKKLGKKKKGFTLQELMDKSDDYYVEQGGKSSKNSEWINSAMTAALVAFDVLEKKGEKFKLA